MPVSISFGGFGFTFAYAIGIVYQLKKEFNIDWSKTLVSAISSGNSAALCLLLYTPEQIQKQLMDTVDYLESRKHSPFYTPDDLRYFINSIPEDAYQRIGNRLVVGVTDNKRKPLLLRSPFSSNDQLKEAIRSSCNIPFITSHGDKYTDGGFSHSGSRIDENTIVIGLKRKTNHDLSLDIKFPLEAVRRTKQEIFELFEKGRSEVIANREPLRVKIYNGMKTPGDASQFKPF